MSKRSSILLGGRTSSAEKTTAEGIGPPKKVSKMVSFNMTDQESSITQTAPTPKALLSPKDSKRSQAQESAQEGHDCSFIEEEREQKLKFPPFPTSGLDRGGGKHLGMAKLNMAAVQEKAQNDEEMILRARANQLAEQPVKGLSKAFLAYQKSVNKNQRQGPSEGDLKFQAFV